MKKILGISLCALFAVSAANAEIASTEWVNQQVGGMDAAATTGEYVKVVSQADGKVSATGASFEKTFNANTDNNAPTSKAVADHVKGAINALDVTAIQGDYIKAVSQADGKVSATAESFADAVTAGGTNAPTAGAVATYVDQKVSNLQGSIDGLGALASKDSVANDDVAEGAAIATSKIAFLPAQTAALDSGITSEHVGKIDANASQISINAGNIGTNTTNIATNTQAIAGMDFTGTTGQYVTTVSQADGKVSATGADFADNVATGGDIAPTSTAVVTYVRDNAVQTVTTGSTNGTIKVDGNPVSVYGLGSAAYTDASTLATTASLKALAYKDTVATADIDASAVTSAKIADGTIGNADVATDAAIAPTKIAFSTQQTAALNSTIDSTKVGQIATNANSISDIQNFLDSMINEAEGYAECKTSGDGCTLVLSANGRFSWEKVTRAATAE